MLKIVQRILEIIPPLPSLPAPLPPSYSLLLSIASLFVMFRLMREKITRILEPRSLIGWHLNIWVGTQRGCIFSFSIIPLPPPSHLKSSPSPAIVKNWGKYFFLYPSIKKNEKVAF